MLHVVSNPHSDLCDWLRQNCSTLRSVIYRTIKVTQLFLVSTIHTCNISLVTLRTLHSLMFVAYKKFIFCVATNMSHNFDMLKKFFCWHNFFAKIFHNIFFWDGKYTATFPSWREYSTVFFPYREIYVISNIFANKLYPAKIFFITSHIVNVLVTLANCNLPDYTVCVTWCSLTSPINCSSFLQLLWQIIWIQDVYSI